MINRVNGFVGNLGRLFMGLAALLAVGGILYGAYYWTSRVSSSDALSAKLAAAEEAKKLLVEENNLLKQQNDKMSVQLKLLTTDERIARLKVLEQKQAGERLESLVELTEVTKDGTPIGPSRRFLLPGSEFRVEYYEVRFEDEHVLNEDVQRGTAIFLFRSIYGSKQYAEDGFVVEERGTRPTVYTAGGGMTEFESKIWADFWRYALDREAAAKEGVHSAQVTAVGSQLKPGMVFELLIRKTGGVSVKPIQSDPPKPSGPTT